MAPALARFESEQPNIEYIHVNVDERTLPQNKALFDKYFAGRSIPYTVLVGPDETARLNWTGLKSYEDLVQEIDALGESSGEKQ